MTSDQNGLGKAHRERDAAQERFEITFDTNPAPSMIVRLEDARVVATNPGLHEVSGRSNDEIKGRSVRKLRLFVNEDVFERDCKVVLGHGKRLTAGTSSFIRYTA